MPYLFQEEVFEFVGSIVMLFSMPLLILFSLKMEWRMAKTAYRPAKKRHHISASRQVLVQWKVHRDIRNF